MGYGTGGCTSQSDYEDESYEEYRHKQKMEEEKSREREELYKLTKEAVIKDAEIRRLKLRVNSLITEVNILKKQLKI